LWRKHRRQQHAGSFTDSVPGARGVAGAYAQADTVAFAHARAQTDTVANAYASAYTLANAWDARGHGD